MRGKTLPRTWQHDPVGLRPAARLPPGLRLRRRSVPDPISEVQIDIDGSLAGVVSDAERAIR
ncbi:MAG: hypothetical protein U5R31_05640 [Acidimicrobiia bacterium]|nr:hypothetical protein [Acidimicrobiia bacterium]